MRCALVQVNHLAEYTCAICCSLVDAPLLTTCHHVFCTACLQDWFDQTKKEARTAAKCPTCSQALDPRHGAGELRLASPLAWRVLGRLRMKCPLLGPLGTPCGWRGEYSELTTHMTAADSHQAAGLSSESADTPGNKERRLAAAEALKAALTLPLPLPLTLTLTLTLILYPSSNPNPTLQRLVRGIPSPQP